MANIILGCRQDTDKRDEPLHTYSNSTYKALVYLGHHVVCMGEGHQYTGWDDMLDGTPDWRETRRIIYDYYRGDYDYGRYRNWIESTINLAITTMSLLYGQGDFEETVRIGVLSGFDADCNPATAGGLVGLMLVV